MFNISFVYLWIERNIGNSILFRDYWRYRNCFFRVGTLYELFRTSSIGHKYYDVYEFSNVIFRTKHLWKYHLNEKKKEKKKRGPKNIKWTILQFELISNYFLVKKKKKNIWKRAPGFINVFHVWRLCGDRRHLFSYASLPRVTNSI